MMNSMNPPQNYSGVTIQIANPSVYAGQNGPNANNGYLKHPLEQQFVQNPACNNPVGQVVSPYCPTAQYYNPNLLADNIQPYNLSQNALPYYQQQPQSTLGVVPSPNNAYPPQYYLNNYNYQNNYSNKDKEDVVDKLQVQDNNKKAKVADSQPDVLASLNKIPVESENYTPQEQTMMENASTPENLVENNNKQNEEQDLSKSQAVIDDLDSRAVADAKAKENTTKKKVVALTDEYIKSLENYLDNPNDEIRLMATKEILTRLDEDKDRYHDAALNALLNKMLQDPSKLVRIAALSALSSQLASGNDYTVQLLQNIQQNPSADKEDVLQAADILLKMSTDTEVKNIPNPAVKENVEEEITGK